jgi:hypothetical protein
MEFVWLPSFVRTAEGVLDEEDVRALEQELIRDPRAGVVLPGTSGARKVRAAMQGRGKRGSARVIYFFDEECEQVYLLLAFPKNVQATITPDQARRLRHLVIVLKAQDCHGNER